MAERLKASVLKTEVLAIVPWVRILPYPPNKENGMSKDCGCGRSPTGKCIGWHGLTNKEYSAKLQEYEKKQLTESAPQLLKD